MGGLGPEYDPDRTIAEDERDPVFPAKEAETAEIIIKDKAGAEDKAAVPDEAAAADKTAAAEEVEDEAAVENKAAAEDKAAASDPPNGSEEKAAESKTGMSEVQTDAAVFYFDGIEFRTPSELARYFQKYADISRRELGKKVRELYAGRGQFVPEFEAWLIAVGKEKELNAWKRKAGGSVF
jgi:hypothetical protein